MKEKKSKKIKKGTNAGIQVLLCILAGGYFLFFTSKIWMPNNETLIEPTSLYARQVMDRHEVYWDSTKERIGKQMYLWFPKMKHFKNAEANMTQIKEHLKNLNKDL